ncbi:hypothetical protein SAMN05518849_11344 [Sphingobium sp. AP50]|uniref:hypothetical protein n=1 Tax=Sphingobium sp. AP50 TaxID=1884369 RepID=UPI0008D2D8DB|nr:hypothetical protein [Sphingobium sp. AP50]SEJ76496.1 hypothetical protein SAMN05518849_11344 [Sphingobium sp. AP50]
MDEYISRAELSPVDRTVVRASAPAQAVQPVTASRASNAPNADSRAAAEQNVADVDQDLASIAEYVEVHARIADILSGLNAGSTGVTDAANAIQTMIPKPIVIVPLLPASKEAVEHAEAVAKRIVERASYSHAAQAHVSRAMVDQIASLS